jgi:hypothetical protein
MIKKILAISLVMIMVLSLAACNGKTKESDGLPSAEEIITRAVQALDDIKTYQFEMNMSLDMALEAENEAYDEAITMSINGASDLENKEMMADMSVTIAMFAGGIETSGKIYIIDDMLYAMNEDPETGTEWNKSEVPAGFWEKMNQIESQVEILKTVQAEVIGSEEVKGVDCYVLNLTPNIEQLWQIANEQSLLTNEEMLPDVAEELLQEMFESFSVKQWVAKDTYFITKSEIDMIIELTPEALGSPEEEGVMTMDITMDLLAYNYNQPVSIVLPPGAEEAVEVPLE